MKGFERENELLSLCGLNCHLCAMYIGNYCPGCGQGEGNQSCSIAKCSLEHDKVEYCSLCHEYPCSKYDNIDEYDSFITHKNQKENLEKVKRLGAYVYNQEQEQKIEILDFLLKNYNDGRKKTLFCIAVNLLELEELKSIISNIKNNHEIASLTLKEKSAYVAIVFQEVAKEKDIILKLHKKKK